jgi:ferredoxin-NADP reductase
MVVDITMETKRAKTFRLALAHPSPHLAGQHYIVRLTAPDGYTASRSYSVASAPDGSNAIDLTVEQLIDGEVSTFLHEEVVIGDELEVRGPIGGFFVWQADSPALLLGGGSGVVPLMAMLRLARKTGKNDLVKLVASVRAPDELLYASEIHGPETSIVYSRTTPDDYPRGPGRLKPEDVAPLLARDQTVYVCGSAGFADAASHLVVDLGIPVHQVRVERFGPTG